ncbi:MAG TPA: class IV adenylate cyclase [Anaerolineales bacterium]|nr:class IV adenylate cyclase [Anaerolineales bacterium]
MSAGGHEVEAKFYIRDLPRSRERLEQAGARLIQSRVLETNLRFDLPGAPLRAEGRVLRLRRDTDVRLTYKSASTNEDGVLRREEIEFKIEDFETAKRFLEALGYQKLVSYEKYRTTYDLNGTAIMLDELPYGNFVEIEGETSTSIRAVASLLELNWEAAIAASYHALFDRVRKSMRLSAEDLSFATFAAIQVAAEDLEVVAADRAD